MPRHRAFPLSTPACRLMSPMVHLGGARSMPKAAATPWSVTRCALCSSLSSTTADGPSSASASVTDAAAAVDASSAS